MAAGQIISLFGNGILRFALPVHLLDMTGSAKLLGIVSGLAFLPLALLSPVGGLIADRVNKRNIMVCLDFFTGFLCLVFILLYGEIGIVSLVLIMMFLLYGISGAYQPSVQASIPFLVSGEQITAANAIINLIASLSGMLGPALGGVAYAVWGIIPVFYAAVGCFVFSAVMELFIRIPFEKRQRQFSLLKEIQIDMKESLIFIGRQRREIGKLTFCCGFVNLVLAALMVIGLPVIVMEHLEFPPGVSSSQLYGYMEAALGLGGIVGGIAAGMLGKRLKFSGTWKQLMLAALTLLPMGASLFWGRGYGTYLVLAVCGLILMVASSAYTIQIMAYVQTVTPPELIGKVISLIMTLCTCAMPAGQVLYGFLFERFSQNLPCLFFAAALISLSLSFYNRNAVREIESEASEFWENEFMQKKQKERRQNIFSVF